MCVHDDKVRWKIQGQDDLAFVFREHVANKMRGTFAAASGAGFENQLSCTQNQKQGFSLFHSSLSPLSVISS
jgi:hypothetical protein